MGRLFEEELETGSFSLELLAIWCYEYISTRNGFHYWAGVWRVF